MFWGITLEGGKKYTQVLERSFHVTMAALGFSNANPDPVSVLVDVNHAQFVLCTLQAGKIPQQPLSLEFTEGEEVSFSIEGDGEVHLTGYLIPEPREYEFSSEEEDESEDFLIDGDDEEATSEEEEEVLEKVESKAIKKGKKGTKKNLNDGNISEEDVEHSSLQIGGFMEKLDTINNMDSNEKSLLKPEKSAKKKNKKRKQRVSTVESIETETTATAKTDDNNNNHSTKDERSPKKKQKKKK